MIIENIGEGEYLARSGNVEVELTWIGEGWCGDYDEEDQNDLMLMRFDVSLITIDNDHIPVDDASYCTQIALTDPEEIKVKAVTFLAEQYADALSSATKEYIPSVKKLGERLSWIGPHWFRDEDIIHTEYGLRGNHAKI
jgi:hypothetical protein